jgi:dolichol-phosphate mannosyltransferase
MKIQFSLILPCYNERKNLEKLIPKICRILRAYKHEIIIVDDNSNDQTIVMFKEKFIKNKNLKYILRKKNKGLGLSIKDGIKKSMYENIIVMDSDFNHRPTDLKKLIFFFNKYNADMVLGTRFLNNKKKLKQHYSHGFFRHISSLLFNKFVNFCTRNKFTDNMSGFFILKKKYCLNTLDDIFYGYGDFYIRLLFYMSYKKIKIIEILVKYGQRKYGESKSRLVNMLIIYAYITIKLRLKFLIRQYINF